MKESAIAGNGGWRRITSVTSAWAEASIPPGQFGQRKRGKDAGRWPAGFRSLRPSKRKKVNESNNMTEAGLPSSPAALDRSRYLLCFATSGKKQRRRVEKERKYQQETTEKWEGKGSKQTTEQKVKRRNESQGWWAAGEPKINLGRAWGGEEEEGEGTRRGGNPGVVMVSQPSPDQHCLSRHSKHPSCAQGGQ